MSSSNKNAYLKEMGIDVWVVEQAGTYEIPGIRFQWWDPVRHELKQQIVPGLSLDIPPVTADDTVTTTSEVQAKSPARSLQLWIAITTTLFALAFWLIFRRKFHNQQADNEKTTFARLANACKNHQAGQAYAAIHTWLEYLPLVATNHPRPVTLNEFADTCNDRQLATDLDKLQSALVTSAPDWQGDDLLSSLQRIRRRIKRQKPNPTEAHLVPLNP